MILYIGCCEISLYHTAGGSFYLTSLNTKVSWFRGYVYICVHLNFMFQSHGNVGMWARFVLKIPENLPLDAAAPLLCAGITVYSPMHHFGMTEKGKSFGLVGLGGLGHMATKFAKAFEMKVTVFSTSPHKEKEAREMLGADDFIVSTDDEKMKVKSKS